MITHVKTKGFKGFDINEDIHPKTLFYGKNKSGKSTRAAAIALTILGYIPFVAKTSKNNAEILNDFGQGKTLTTAVVCNDVEFERHYSRSSKGSVSQRLRVDKKKYSAADFAVELSKAGSPKIIDVNAFISLSDQKKIDSLFELFPPKSDLKNLDNQIDKAKKKISILDKDKTTTTGTIKRLIQSKLEIELPAGTLAETQADIETLTEKVKKAQEDLKQAEIEQAEVEATKKAKTEQKEESQKKFDKIMADGGPSSNHVTKQESGKDPGPVTANVIKKNLDNIPTSFHQPEPSLQKVMNFGNDPAESIQKILDVLNNSGCEICAAAIVAKQELKKFKQEVAA